MKKNLLLALIFQLIFSFTYAQRCAAPMPANVFRQNLNQLALKPNDQQKLQYAKTLLQGSCLLSSQVKELAMVFGGDYYRFEFCKRAWKHTFDPGNFFDVYDAFGSLSAALRLYDAVNERGNSTPGTNNPPPPFPSAPSNWYPDLAYPLPVGYRGVTGCQLPLADNDFEVLCRSVVAQRTDGTRRTEALRFVSVNCISMGQAMKLSILFELESNRLSFLKEILTKLYDIENYAYATEVFSNMPYKNDWLAYGASVATPPANDPVPPPVVVCEVPPADYSDIKRSIGNVSVNSTKLNLAKQIISTKKCFTVNQIAGIINLFSVESSRLDIALFSYEFCTNKDDYYKLTDSFTTSGSKNSLLEFLGGR